MITFLIQNKNRSRSTIYMQVSFRGATYRKSIGLSIPACYWSSTKHRAKVTADFPEGVNINDVIESHIYVTQNILKELRNRLTPPSQIEFFAIFNRAYYIDFDAQTKNIDASLTGAINGYISSRRLSDLRVSKIKVLGRLIRRYELYSGHPVLINNLQSSDIIAIRDFMQIEHTFFDKKNGNYVPKQNYDYIYKEVPESRGYQPRGINAIIVLLGVLRAVIKWSKLATSDPFDGIVIGQEVYADPIYLTINERNTIANYDLSDHPSLARQRDVFILQCLIGCRISDLYRLTPRNVINNEYIEYIAQKTVNKHPRVLRIPLTDMAKQIISRYSGGEDLIPTTSQQKYNIAIKEVLRICGIDRMVTVLDPMTLQSKQIPIYQCASSHMARKTFIGNLYAAIKDPNIISSMSGHCEGSRAFSRYREIDDAVKIEAIKLIDGKKPS